MRKLQIVVWRSVGFLLTVLFLCALFFVGYDTGKEAGRLEVEAKYQQVLRDHLKGLQKIEDEAKLIHSK
jgi:hypothetical protein